MAVFCEQGMRSGCLLEEDQSSLTSAGSRLSEPQYLTSPGASSVIDPAVLCWGLLLTHQWHISNELRR